MGAGENRREIVGGLTTFLTMVSVVVVVPTILSAGGTGIPFSGAMTATVFVCFLGTLVMGLYARVPFGIAPSPSSTIFFTSTLVLSQGVPWRTALGLVFWSGVLLLVFSVTPLRAVLARAIPPSVKAGMAAGLGLFLTFSGLQAAGILAANPATIVALGKLDHTTFFFAFGLALTAALASRRIAWAFAAGIFGVTILGMLLGDVKVPERVLTLPDFGSVTLRMDVLGALTPSLLPLLVTLFFADLFDSMTTFVGVADAQGLKGNDGQPKNLRESMVADAFGALTAGLFGAPRASVTMESAVGIETGARGGRAAVVCALCFIPFLFIGPLARMVPGYATAPVLVVVGAMMFRTAVRADLSKVEDLVPAFLTAILVPLTFSITQGVLWGFIAHVVLYAVVGRVRDVHPMMFFVSTVAVGLLWLDSNR